MLSPFQELKAVVSRCLKVLSAIASICLISGLVLRPAKATPPSPYETAMATEAPKEKTQRSMKSEAEGGLVKTQRSTGSSGTSGSGTIPVEKEATGGNSQSTQETIVEVPERELARAVSIEPKQASIKPRPLQNGVDTPPIEKYGGALFKIAGARPTTVGQTPGRNLATEPLLNQLQAPHQTPRTPSVLGGISRPPSRTPSIFGEGSGVSV